MALSAFDLTGKVAIVTGAGKGIGKAIALGFARAGADVVVLARTAADIEATADEVRATGRKALAVPADTRNIDQITNVLKKTIAAFGKVDILVNNAAGGDSKHGPVGYVEDLSIDAWKEGIEGALNSVFYCTKIIGKVMIKQKSGNIINISSGMGLGPFPGGASPAAAKAGVISFTKTLALEWAPYNIRVNCIAPGYTETPLTARGWEEHPEVKEGILKYIALGRFAQPEDMATVAIFLAAPASGYITGETLYPSGGMITTVSPDWQEYCKMIRSKTS